MKTRTSEKRRASRKASTKNSKCAGKEPRSCVTCGKTYSRQSKLLKHLLVHCKKSSAMLEEMEHSRPHRQKQQPSVGNHSAGNHSPGNHSPGNHSPGNHSPGNHSPGNHSPGNHSPGNHSPGNHSSGNHSPEVREEEAPDILRFLVFFEVNGVDPPKILYIDPLNDR